MYTPLNVVPSWTIMVQKRNTTMLKVKFRVRIENAAEVGTQ